MSIHLSDSVVAGLPQEPMLLSEVSVRLLEPSERARFDELLTREHYLKNATVVGQTLRYVAEYERQWLALLVFSSAAFHLKPRDRWLQWSARQVAQRRHLIAQNQRFLVLAAPGRWPNLASRVLKLTCDRPPEPDVQNAAASPEPVDHKSASIPARPDWASGPARPTPGSVGSARSDDAVGPPGGRTTAASDRGA